jgi:hypothetical protein
MRGKFLTARKKENMKRGKAGINSLMLGWKFSHLCDCMVLNIGGYIWK